MMQIASRPVRPLERLEYRRGDAQRLDESLLITIPPHQRDQGAIELGLLKRASGVKHRFGGEERSGWLPPGAAIPLATPVHDLTLMRLPPMRLPRVRLTMRRMMAAVAVAALVSLVVFNSYPVPFVTEDAVGSSLLADVV
jgi:hypothetical protein